MDDSQNNSGQKEEKERWYPGQYLKKAVNRRRTVANEDEKKHDHLPSRSSLCTENELTQQGATQSTAGYVDAEFQIGTLKLKIVDFRYLVEPASATLSVGRVLHRKEYVTNMMPSAIEFSFPLQEITDDVVIKVTGKNDNSALCGISVISIVTLLGNQGQFSVPEWRQLFPLQARKLCHERFKFSSGYSDINGYAMDRPKDFLGFICTSAVLNLKVPLYKAYLAPFRGNMNQFATDFEMFALQKQDSSQEMHCQPQESRADLQRDSSPMVIPLVASLALNRDIERLHLLLTSPPMVLKFVNSFVDCGIVVLFLAFACTSLEAWQIPFCIYTFVLTCGFLASKTRNFSHVIVWNDPLDDSLSGAGSGAGSGNSAIHSGVDSAGGSPSAGSSATVGLVKEEGARVGAPRLSSVHSGAASCSVSAGKPLLLASTHGLALVKCARTLNCAVHAAEVFKNLLSFGDTQASKIFYGALLLPVCASTLLLSISTRLFAFLVMATFLLLWSNCSLCAEARASKIGEPLSHGHSVAVFVSRVMSQLESFLKRVPDDLELNHRYIAGISLVKERGQEMKDAAKSFVHVK